MLCHVDDAGNHLCENGCPLTATMDDRQNREMHVFFQHAAGHRVPVRVASSPIFDDLGEVIGAVESFFEDNDWRESVERSAVLEELAYVDALTNLPNRRHMEQRLAAKLDELARYSWPCGVLLVDIDRFKSINDTHGHAVGDLVLQMVARTLALGVRGLDVVGRWGGEEFLVIVTNPTSRALFTIGNRMRALVEASDLHEPVALSVTVSVGAVVARPGESAADLLRRADENLYRAKSSGRNRVCGEET